MNATSCPLYALDPDPALSVHLVICIKCVLLQNDKGAIPAVRLDKCMVKLGWIQLAVV